MLAVASAFQNAANREALLHCFEVVFHLIALKFFYVQASPSLLKVQCKKAADNLVSSNSNQKSVVACCQIFILIFCISASFGALCPASSSIRVLEQVS